MRTRPARLVRVRVMARARVRVMVRARVRVMVRARVRGLGLGLERPARRAAAARAARPG